MPDYSEYIIKINREIKIFSNRRGHYTFRADIFLGPDLTKAFILRQHQHEYNYSIGDNAFSGVVLDFDKKELLLDDGHTEDEDGTGIFLTELFIKVLEIRYPGWKIKYAHNSITDRMQYVQDQNYDLQLNYESEGWDEPRGTFISLKQNAEIKLLWNELSLYEIIPKGIQYLKNYSNHVEIPKNRFPFGGLHFDVDNNTVFFWYCNPTPGAKKWAQPFLKKVHLTYLPNGYYTHFDIIEKNVFKDVISTAKEKALAILKHDIVNSYEQLSKMSYPDRYQKELKIMSTAARQRAFDETILKLNTLS